MTSAADSGVETGNDSNDSTIQEKLFKMDLESPQHQVAQDILNSSEKSQEIIKPEGSSDIVLMDRSLSHLQPTTLMHGYEYHPKHPSETCFAMHLRPNQDIGGIFVSGGPLGTQYQRSELPQKLRLAARMRHGLPRFRSMRDSLYTLKYWKSRDTMRMCRASCQNNTEAMRQMLESGMSPNVRDEYKRTPLHLAACMGYADMVKLLLDYGADPNAKDSIGNTPLHLAACTNHVPVITLLLKAGTHVSASHSPLQLAITKFNIIKRSVMPHPILKEQVAQVISMLTEYMRRQEAPSLDAELLNKFESLVRVSDSSEQVESNIRDLLDNLSSLDISSSS